MRAANKKTLQDSNESSEQETENESTEQETENESSGKTILKPPEICVI